MIKRFLLLPLMFSALLASEVVLAAPSREVVRFGVILPLSGNLSALGTKVLEGVLLGSRLLSREGAPGVVFHIRDTQGSPEEAAGAVEELAARGVSAIIGPIRGDEAKAAGVKARKEGVPLVAITPSREVAGGIVHRLYLREEEEADRLTRHAIDDLGFRKFAILAPATEQGRFYRNLFWDAVIRNGGEIVGSESFEPGDNPILKEQIQRLTGLHGLTAAELKEFYDRERLEQEAKERALLSSFNPVFRGRSSPALRNRDFSKYRPAPLTDFDAIFMPVSSTEAGQIAPQFPYYDVDGVVFLGIRSWNYSALINVGKEYVEGARFPTEWSPATEEGRVFLREFEVTYGRVPGALEAYGYDAAKLLMLGWSRGRAQSRSAVAEFLATLDDVDAVTGPLTSMSQGDIAVEPKMMTVQGKKIVPDLGVGR